MTCVVFVYIQPCHDMVTEHHSPGPFSVRVYGAGESMNHCYSTSTRAEIKGDL